MAWYLIKHRNSFNYIMQNTEEGYDGKIRLGRPEIIGTELTETCHVVALE
jgi:hypothetical protein